MKKVLYVIAFLGCIVMALSGCALLKPSARINYSAGILPLPPYSGPKARITVADFVVNAAKANSEIANDLRQILVTTLINSNRFTVLERQTLSGSTQQQVLTADIIISTVVTEFEPQASGGRAGVGGGGGVGSGVLGALLGAPLNKENLGLEVRIVDASSSEILAYTQVQGQASDVSGAVMGGPLGTGVLGAGLCSYANTPMEKAIRICIIEAVRYIAQAIPASYYKY